MIIPGPAAGLAAGDCELIRSGLLGQPANSISSLALVAAGGWLVWRARQEQGPTRWQPALVGAATIAAGVGSAAFHGPMWPGSQLLHDLGLLSVPLAFVTAGASELGVRPREATAGLWGATAGLLVAAPTSTSLLLGAAVAAAVGTEAALWLSGQRGPLEADRTGYLAAAGVGLTGLALNLLGGTGGPLCDPSSLLQSHAAWHVLAGIAVALYASTALTNRNRGPAPG